MKTYIQFINEASYKRFFKKNKNLTRDQIEKIDDFFKKNRKAAKDFDENWGFQSDVPQSIEWKGMENFMNNYRLGRKMNFENLEIPGKKGVDYWPLRISNKKYIATIPLNVDAARYMNSCRYGTIESNHCIGWTNGTMYWDIHVIDEQKVPIYIVDANNHKWVVMILPDNKHYEVWDKFNKEDIAKVNKNPIPGFNIRKELIQGKAKLYDEIREEFYKGLSFYEEIVEKYKNESNVSIRVSTVYDKLDKEFQFIDTFFDVKWFSGGILYIIDNAIQYQGGVFNSKNTPVVDDDISIRFHNVSIENSKLILTDDKSEVAGCSVYYTNSRYVTFIDSDIHDGVYKKCTFRNCNIIDGEYLGCEMRYCSIITDVDDSNIIISY